jgi:hypothetical protein
LTGNCSNRNILLSGKCGKGFSLLFFTFSGVSSMKRFLNFGTAYKAVMVGVLVGGMATACQNGNSPVGGFLESADTKTAADTKTSGAVAQNSKRPSEAESRVVNQQLENASKALARLIADNSSATVLHKEASKKFDGVSNVLWKTLDAEKSFGRGLSAALVDKNVNKAAAEFASEGALQAAMRRIESKFGANLHLFWYNAEKWDGKTSPIVVFTPVDKDPEKAAFLPGYDSKGNVYQVDKKFADANVVVVLTFNERTEMNGSLRTATSGSSVGKIGASVQNNTYLEISQISFPYNEDWYDGWFGGAAEFRATSYIPGGSFLGQTDFYPSIAETPGTISVYRQLYAAPSPVQTTRVDWVERDASYGEWLLFDDDILDSHSVPLGNSTQYNNPTVTYSW